MLVYSSGVFNSRKINFRELRACVRLEICHLWSTVIFSFRGVSVLPTTNNRNKMAKRIAQSSINWASLAERVPAEQRVNLSLFKSKSDVYLRRVLANPAEAPKIDWAQYKNVVPVAGMVDSFQKQYEALKVPYPVDNLSSKVDAQWAEVKKQIDSFVLNSKSNIAKYEKEIADIKALLPFEQMTMEDFKDAYPDLALDPINKPTYWPHDAEEQIGYVNPDQPATTQHH